MMKEETERNATAEHQATCDHAKVVKQDKEWGCERCALAFFPPGEVEAMLRGQQTHLMEITSALLRDAYMNAKGEPAEPKDDEACTDSPTGKHFWPLGVSECVHCGMGER